MKRTLFGKYNLFIDESVHIIASLLVYVASIILGLDIFLAAVCFFSGIVIDMDHFLNEIIAKLIGIKGYRGIMHGTGGYTIKILHGFDVALAIAVASYLASNNMIFALCLFANLCLHEMWDFLVYPHTWKELLFITRAASGFKPGRRGSFKGIFFDISSLKY